MNEQYKKDENQIKTLSVITSRQLITLKKNYNTLS